MGSRPPNVIFILMDDMGWRDVGFMGNRFVETPNLDRLAAGGLVFTQAYASAPNCAPTRACLMSGQYPPRHGIYTVVDPRQPAGSTWQPLLAAYSKSELSPQIITLAELLRDGGYATAFYGMWNLGRGRAGPVSPGGQGFQQVVFPESLGFAKDAYKDDRGNYLSDRLTDEVLGFIEQHRDRPFFVYLADHAVHSPHDPKPDLLAKYEKKVSVGDEGRDDPAYAATIEAVDQNVGRIVDALARLKLTDQTLIVFTSDNGGTRPYAAPLAGGKGELYEGGIRVPLVVSWPGIKRPGRECSVPVSTVDWYPTLIELTGLKAPQGQPLDGTSLVSVLDGESDLQRESLFWHFPCYVGRATPSSAIRVGDFKLIEFFEGGGRRELYNLSVDPGEQRNLAEVMPEKADELYRRLRDWQTATGAAIPRQPNPNYDPRSARPRRGNRPR
ncbi:MAG: sulfatase [Pirellulales bacterium]